MATALNVINRALRMLGVKSSGNSAGGDEANDALDVLNTIVDEWSNDKQLNHYSLNETFSTVANVGAYSIGPQANIITDSGGTFTAGSVAVTVNSVTFTETFATDKDSTLTALAAHLVSEFPSIIKTAVYSSSAHTITITPTGYAKMTITVSTTSVTGTMTMAVAVSGSNWFNTVRPLKLESVYIRFTESADSKLEIINNEQFQEIYQKSTSGNSGYVNYVPGFPYGTIRLWPVPVAEYTIGITQTPHLGTYRLVSDVVSLPEGYRAALEYQLAYELAPEYGKNPNDFFAQMTAKKAIIMRTNFTPIILKTDIFEPRIIGDDTMVYGGSSSSTLQEFPDNAAALAGGLAVGDFYKNGDFVCVVY